MKVPEDFNEDIPNRKAKDTMISQPVNISRWRARSQVTVT